MDIMRQLGFSSEILNYKTEMPTNELFQLQFLLRGTRDFTVDFFNLMDIEAQTKKKKEEMEKAKCIENIASKIIDLLKIE